MGECFAGCPVVRIPNELYCLVIPIGGNQSDSVFMECFAGGLGGHNSNGFVVFGDSHISPVAEE